MNTSIKKPFKKYRINENTNFINKSINNNISPIYHNIKKQYPNKYSSIIFKNNNDYNNNLNKYNTNEITKNNIFDNNGVFSSKDYFKLGARKLYKPDIFLKYISNNKYNSNNDNKIIKYETEYDKTLFFNKDILIYDYKLAKNLLSLSSKNNNIIKVKKIASAKILNNKIILLLKININNDDITFIKNCILEGDTKIYNFLINLSEKNIYNNKDRLTRYIKDFIEIRKINLWEDNLKNIKNIKKKLFNI